MTDRDGTANDTYTIPETVGIDYLVGGAGLQKVVSAGTYSYSYSYSTDGIFFAGARAKPDYIRPPVP